MTLLCFRDLMWLSLLLMFMNSEEKEVNCGSHFTSRTGTISSPNYPQKYSPNLNCVWTISVSGNNPEIKLKFSDFHLPENINGKCSDYVSIYHGTDAIPSKLVGTYCGSTLPSTQLHKVNSLEIHFVSDDDDIFDKGFVMSFTVSVASSTITTSQATAGIVAAIFCGIVFIGVATMRCIMMGACQQCHVTQNQQNQARECVGTNETLSNYVMDCPPSYRTVMEHPENFPTPHITPYPTPSSSARVSIVELEGNDGELPPPYFCFATTGTSNTTSTATDVQSTATATTNTTTAHQLTENTSHSRGISAHDVAERLLSRHSRSVTAVVEEPHTNLRMNDGRHDQQSEQPTCTDSQPSVEDGEMRTEMNDSSSSHVCQRDVSQSNNSETDHDNNGTDNHNSSNGTNNHNSSNGTNNHSSSNRTNDQNNRSGTNDQDSRNGTIDQNNKNGTNDQNNRSEENGNVDQTGVSERSNQQNDNSTNGTSHQRRSNRRIRQHDDVSGKPRHDDESRVQYVEVRL